MIGELASFANNLEKTVKEFLNISNALRQDIENLIGTYQHDWSSQPLRRMFVRAYWSMIEGEVYCTKQYILRACELEGRIFSAEELVFLSETYIVVDPIGMATVKAKHEGTLSNVKRTVEIAAARFNLDWCPDFGTQGWKKLARSLESRHRITHPKMTVELVVSDNDLNVHKDVFAWLIDSLNELQSSLPRKYDVS